MEKTKEIKEVKEIIYQIFVGQNLEELYTFEQPIIEKEQVKCRNLIKKGTVSQVILNAPLEEYFNEEASDSNKENVFPLSNGFSLKCIDKKELLWLSATKEKAETLLKDKVLAFYQNLVPDLVGNLNKLKLEMQSLKTAGQYDGDDEEDPYAPIRQRQRPQPTKQPKRNGGLNLID